MNTRIPQAHHKIKALLESQTLAVLSTQQAGQPYASLVAFAASDDLRQIVFLTPTGTRKYDNLVASPRVALLVHNSRNQAEDIHNAISITAIGKARTVAASERWTYLPAFLERHPHLEAFASLPTTAIICVTVQRYFMVSHFQDVVQVDMTL